LVAERAFHVAALLKGKLETLGIGWRKLGHVCSGMLGYPDTIFERRPPARGSLLMGARQGREPSEAGSRAPGNTIRQSVR
jgi:hypothetical protein